MKPFFVTLLMIAGLATAVHARTLTAVANGNWQTASTWSPAAVPTNNDVVLIPSDKIVSITNNINEKTSFMELRIAGILDFVGGGSKLWLNGQSMVFVYPTGSITANQNSQVIILGNTTVLAGPNTGTATVSGPAVATSSSPSASSSSATSTTAGFLPYSPSALPVVFIAFTATRQGSDVLVQWSTASEEAASRFEVEVSTDGRTWTSYGTVAAAGNSNTVRTYSYNVRNLPGSLQVRVKQVDISGSYTYTATRTLKGGAEGSIKMTAASGRLVLTFGTELKGATIRVINLAGQVLQEQKVASAIGQVLVPVSQKGLCIVAVLSENEIAASQKLVL
ncbi:discoidin domain-containing protein [Flaviaesturariibacter terrae]